MGEVIQFIPKSERERVRLVREARAIYDSIFPTGEPVVQPEKATAAHAVGADVHRREGALKP